MIFTYFDPVEYQGKEITDIFKDYRTYIKRVAKRYTLKTYFIKGNPRPEQLSYELYDSPQYYWLLLMLNDMYDPFYGWVTTQEAVYQKAEQMFVNTGGTNQVSYHINEENEKFYNLVEHPINSGLWYDKGDKAFNHLQYTGTLIPVEINQMLSFYNDAKRTIKILDPVDVPRFMDDLSREMEKVFQ